MAWMRQLAVLAALVLGAPLALAGHAVDHDPLGLYDPEGLNLRETCAETLFRDAAPFPELPLAPTCDGLTLLVESSRDGYVVAIQRLDDTHFEVKVRHALTLPVDGGNLPVAAGLVPLAPLAADCATASDCGGRGLFVHGLTLSPDDDRNPFTGAFPAQRIAASADGLSWTIEVPGAPSSPVYVAVVGVIGLANGDYVRGYYNPLKLATPVDLLDAVAYPTLL